MSQLQKSKEILIVIFVYLILSLLVTACTSGDVTVGVLVATATTGSTIPPTPTFPPLPTPTNAPTATIEVPPTVPPATPPTTLTLLPTSPTPSIMLTPITTVPPVTTTDAVKLTGNTTISQTVVSAEVSSSVTSPPAVSPTAIPTPIPAPSPYKGQIVYSSGGDIWTMKPDSVAKTRLTTDGGNFERGTFPDGFNRNPVWSPDGKQIAFASARDVYAQPRYDSGYEIYLMKADGSGLQRISQSSDAINTQRLPVSWLSTGQLLIRKVTASKQLLVLFDITNHKEYPLPIKDAQFLTYSPDKARIAFTTLKAGPSPAKTISDLLVVGASGGTAKNLTKNPEELNNTITAFSWSPEGARIAYIESNGDVCGYSYLYTIGADGSGKREIIEGNGLISNVSWSPDGTRLIYGEVLCTGETSLKLVDTNGGEAQNLTEGQNPQWNSN